jgi:ADP-ribose pyrophosphatase YjhB (NUDIX family)
MALSKMPRVGVGTIITKGNQALLIRRHNVRLARDEEHER